MFTPKRQSNTGTPLGSARVTRSQSLKTKDEMSPRVALSSGLNSSLIYTDSLLESYKTPLPIKVSEIIAKSTTEEINCFSSTLLPNGHVCFTTENKLYIWKLRKSYKNIQCNELTFPLARMKIKSNCVDVQCINNKDYVALCATIDGHIIYWPSIFNEFNIDTKCDFPTTDEVACLISLATKYSYLMVTSNGLMWSIMVDSGTKQIVTSKISDNSKGLISGIGRRFTSFMLGNQGKNGPSFKCVLRSIDSNEIYLLLDKSLQKWRYNNDNAFTNVFQTDVYKLFYEAYIAHEPNFTKCSIIFQDGSITKNSLYILALIEDEDFQFAIGEFDTYQSDLKLKSFNLLNYKINPSDIQNTFHLHAMRNQHSFYVHSFNTIIGFTGPSLELMGETKFQTLNDRVVASELLINSDTDHDMIYFSLNHGILKGKDTNIRIGLNDESLLMTSINDKQLFSQSFGLKTLNQTTTSINDTLNGSIQSEESFSYKYANTTRQYADFTLTNINPEQTALLRFKAAFQLYLKKDERESEAIIKEIFESQGSSPDLLCVELSEKLIDDVPAHDPRWAENNVKSGKSLSSNLIISNQLTKKLQLHEYFLKFLKAFNIWQNLNTIIYNNREILTRLALEEHGEKLRCALFIREHLYIKHPDLLNAAIEYTAKNREDLANKLIYPHDVFYRKVSKVDDIFNSMMYIEQDVMKNNSNEQAITYLIDTTYAFVELLKVSQLFNKEKAKLYESQNPNENKIEYLRWTSSQPKDVSLSSNSIVNLCIKQHKLVADYGISNCGSSEKKSILINYLYNLDNVIFEELELRLKSIKLLKANQLQLAFEKSYDSIKSKLIEFFVKHKELDKARELAEKYVDFHTLVLICEINNSHEQLESYLERFSNLTFSDFVISYFKNSKKLSFLLKSDLIKRDDLSKCLDSHKTLCWIKDIKNESFDHASKTLKDLALLENESYKKRKTLLSLSKLTRLANGDDSNEETVKNINRKLEYLNYIEELPRHLKNLAYSPDKLPTFKPETLIEIYVTNENSNEYCFKLALELLEYINFDSTTAYTQDKIGEMRLNIFVQSILLNNWETICDAEDPESKLSDTIFFKTINLMKQAGEDLTETLPSVQTILNHELLAEQVQNKTFVYLLRACYELLTI